VVSFMLQSFDHQEKSPSTLRSREWGTPGPSCLTTIFHDFSQIFQLNAVKQVGVMY